MVQFTLRRSFEVFASSPDSYVRLGRTDLQVLPIGLGCGMGISSADLEYAIDRGINYVFWSSDLHPTTYSRANDALSAFCGKGSARRDRVVLAACSYVCDPEKIMGVVVDQLSALKLDHVDVFVWGWVTEWGDPDVLVARTKPSVCEPSARTAIDSYFSLTRQVEDELRCRGYARYLGISTHEKTIAARLAANELVDVVMVRYNIAHRRVEHMVFDGLDAARRPGIVAFNTTHNADGSLTDVPPGLPSHCYRPTHADLYRFALQRPEVDVVLTGPSNREHVDHALSALQAGPLEPKLYEYLKTFGDLHMGRVRVA
jgi:aryl-alcohol dehydrogenase-like predicted oxidoreductase